MGEYNDPVDHPEAMVGVLDALAKYLYDHYETDKHNIPDWDSRSHQSIGDDPEPWHTAGKRMREKWFEEAYGLVEHFIALYKAA